jgi:mono/diheme cytochrome c family protein
VVAQGQGEMPALGNNMTAAEIDAVSKYVVKSWPPVQRARRPPPPGVEAE